MHPSLSSLSLLLLTLFLPFFVFDAFACTCSAWLFGVQCSVFGFFVRLHMQGLSCSTLLAAALRSYHTAHISPGCPLSPAQLWLREIGHSVILRPHSMLSASDLAAPLGINCVCISRCQRQVPATSSSACPAVLLRSVIN